MSCLVKLTPKFNCGTFCPQVGWGYKKVSVRRQRGVRSVHTRVGVSWGWVGVWGWKERKLLVRWWRSFWHETPATPFWGFSGDWASICVQKSATFGQLWQTSSHNGRIVAVAGDVRCHNFVWPHATKFQLWQWRVASRATISSATCHKTLIVASAGVVKCHNFVRSRATKFWLWHRRVAPGAQLEWNSKAGFNRGEKIRSAGRTNLRKFWLQSHFLTTLTPNQQKCEETLLENN